MQQETLRTVARRLQPAMAFARSVEPRSLPSRQDLCTDAALAVLIVLAARLTGHSGGTRSGSL